MNKLQEFVAKSLTWQWFSQTLLICFSDLLSSNESVEPKYKQLILGMIERYAGREHFSLTQAVQKRSMALFTNYY